MAGAGEDRQAGVEETGRRIVGLRAMGAATAETDPERARPGGDAWAAGKTVEPATAGGTALESGTDRKREVWRLFWGDAPKEYLEERHGLRVSRETLRQWLIGAGEWKSSPAQLGRDSRVAPRRSVFGELVQWDTSEHTGWKGRSEKIYLCHDIDDVTTRLGAVLTEENLRLLWSYLEPWGRWSFIDRANRFRRQPAGRTLTSAKTWIRC